MFSNPRLVSLLTDPESTFSPPPEPNSPVPVVTRSPSPFGSIIDLVRDAMPLTELKPSPDFEKVVETCGGRGIKVDTPDQVMPALEKGLAAVRSGTRVTLNVRTPAR